MPASSNTNLLATGGFSKWLCASIHRAKWNGWRKLVIDITSPCSRRGPAERAGQKGVAECLKSGALGVVLAVAVPARGGLVKVGFVPHCLQLCRHLAGMAGMHAVVAPARRDQDRRGGAPPGRGGGGRGPRAEHPH